ncbi:hypothetical protein EZV62_003640 [Acer yangbiense]|uniref:Retrotransposon gag domain-containing protein n=1 Tax=Acer yangbiense TaxID=1000413 RepID=A0A5C7IHZ8_9ROSI|nr:hypothetical protein EZV62_003640 [Acer yangbiense]
MSDHRLEQVENELGSLAAGQRELQEAMKTSEERLLKHMENFFARFLHTVEDMMTMPSPLAGPVLWYQRFKNRREGVNWEVFKYELHLRYGPSKYQKYFGDLTKLKQTGSIRDYQMEFDRLLHRASHLSEEQQVGCFVSGLKEAIRVDVQACNPISLSAAIGLARLYESRMYDQREGGYVEPRKAPSIMGQPPLPLASLARAHNPSIKRLSPAELQERRTRGLCFNCDEKFSPGHHCKKLFLIEGIFPSVDELLDETTVEEEEEEEIPEIVSCYFRKCGTSDYAFFWEN